MFKNILQFFSIPAFQLLIALMLVCFIDSSFSDPVCKAKPNCDLNELKDKNFIVDKRMVALSSEMRVARPYTKIKRPSCSLFFVIDNSATMLWDQDTAGLRFRIFKDILDTIKVVYGSFAEVGVAVFQKYLYFRPDIGTTVLKLCQGLDSGAYIPLLNLADSYPPSGNSGYTILKNFIDTVLNMKNNRLYADLKYKPVPNWPDSENPLSNINAGFSAAKEAFKNSKLRYDRHFIVFLTDGNVSWPLDSSKYDFISGTDVPTTFTIFFTGSQTPPQHLEVMKNNIRANGYSSKNPSSDIWSSLVDWSSMKKKIIDSMYFPILGIVSIAGTPDSITVNDIQSKTYDWGPCQFSFKNLFPLVRDKTDFACRIKYTVYGDTILGGDTILIKKDSTSQVNFSITIREGSITPDTFEVKCWNRNIGFYYENNKITTANKAMKTLEIRFTGDSGVAKYWYTNVTVEVTSTIAKDKETFVLSKAGSYYSYVFPLNNALSSTPNNGILEIADIDTLSATFKNTETPQLPLDTLNIAIPYNASSDINPNTVVADKPFQFYIKKTVYGKAIIVLKNLPSSGEIALYTVKGQSILKKKLAKSDSIFTFGFLKASSVYIMNLRYKNRIVRQLLIVN